MKLIDDFIKQYNKEFDFYQELSKIVANKIEDQLFKRGIKAIVTYRAKRPDRLKDKLIKRNENKKYQTIAEIFDDIVDLSGVRVSLYFPSERDILDEIVNELFTIEKRKQFPSEAHTPKHDKRFSGYWATHYRVKLKEDSTNKRYLDNLSEIQIASVLMHAWSEVEHDLVYKPFSGELSREELSILDEINGLVLSGEIALERLQRAISEKTKKKKEITDKYELTNTIINFISNEFQNKLKLGDTYLLNNYLDTIKTLNTSEIYKLLSKVNIEANETVTDQLLNMWLVDHYENDKSNIKKYFRNLHLSDKKASAFESFVRCWVILEKAVREILNRDNIQTKKYLIPDFSILKTKKILTENEVNQLRQLRQVRNYLLHGIETPSNQYLQNSFQILKDLTQKVVGKVPNKTVRESLAHEIGKI